MSNETVEELDHKLEITARLAVIKLMEQAKASPDSSKAMQWTQGACNLKPYLEKSRKAEDVSPKK